MGTRPQLGAWRRVRKEAEPVRGLILHHACSRNVILL